MIFTMMPPATSQGRRASTHNRGDYHTFDPMASPSSKQERQNFRDRLWIHQDVYSPPPNWNTLNRIMAAHSASVGPSVPSTPLTPLDPMRPFMPVYPIHPIYTRNFNDRVQGDLVLGTQAFTRRGATETPERPANYRVPSRNTYSAPARVLEYPEDL